MRIDKSIVQKVEHALRFATAEGMAYGAVMGFGDNYIVAFAVALQTSSFLIGILCSVPGFLASLAQLWDAAIVRKMGQDLGYGGHEAVVIVEDYVIVIGHELQHSGGRIESGRGLLTL